MRPLVLLAVMALVSAESAACGHSGATSDTGSASRCRYVDSPDAEPFVNGRVGGHAWSPDSTCLAVVQCPVGQAWGCDLQIVDRSLLRAYRVTSDTDLTGLGGWQDGWIYYRRQAVEGLPPQYAGDGEIWRIRPDGGERVQLTDTLHNGIKTSHNPVYENIGTAVMGFPVPGTSHLFLHAHDGNGWYTAFRCPLTGCDDPSEVVEISSRWAWTIGPSQGAGPLLYVRGTDWDSPMDLLASSLEGDRHETLVVGLERAPRFVGSPDQAWVAYADEVGERDLRVVAVDGTGDHALFPASADDLLMNFLDEGTLRGNVANARVWAPDSSRILFASNRTEPFHVFRADVDGTTLLQITDEHAFHWGPSYSPDGAWISFHRLPVDFDRSRWPHLAELVVVTDP